MIPGLSGSLLSHDALALHALTTAGGVEASRMSGLIRSWHAEVMREGGPAWTGRSVFDRIVAPFCAVLGFHVTPQSADSAYVHALLQANGSVVAVAVAAPWGRDHATSWRESVRRGIGAGVRWCFCFNGPSLRLFDARRTHSRRFAELDLSAIAEQPAAFSVAWHLLRGTTFVAAEGTTALDHAVDISERHRTSVRESLQDGVHESLTHLTSAFVAATARKAAGRRQGKQDPSAAFDEALVVIYRVLFLLFAEARGLVPVWHPLYRDSYTIEGLRPFIETLPCPRGVWASVQAIARLAHSGCEPERCVCLRSTDGSSPLPTLRWPTSCRSTTARCAMHCWQ